MELILGILAALMLFMLSSIHTKKPQNPLIELREELEFINLDPSEINDVLEKYKNTYSYKCYEFKKAYYDLGQDIKNTLKNRKKYHK